MRSVPVSVGPRLLAFVSIGFARETFGCDELFESNYPVVIVLATIVGFVAFDSCGEFRGQRGRPFFPTEMSLSGETDGECECLRLPGLFEYRAGLVAWKARQLRIG